MRNAFLLLCCFVAFCTTATACVQEQTETPKQAAAPILPVDTLPDTIDIDFVPSYFSAERNTPVDNELTDSKVELGRKLFFDPILSSDGTVSCASCHQPEHGFASSNPKAVGISGQVGARNTPTVLNRAYGSQFFWDGRAATLEEQALIPIEDPLELGSDLDEVIQALRASDIYPALFAEAFLSDEPADLASVQTPVTKQNLGKALASFQRTLFVGPSRVDRFHDGDYSALDSMERTGLWIFQSKGNCWKCHSGD